MLLAEAGTPPHFISIKHQALKTFITQISQGTNSPHSETFRNTHYLQFYRWRSHQQPFDLVGTQLATKANIRLSCVISVKGITPPLEIIAPLLCPRGLPFQTPGLPIPAYNQLFYSTLAEPWPDWEIVAVDASKTPSRTTIGIYIPDQQYQACLSVDNRSSIFTAEAVALSEAISVCQQRNKPTLFLTVYPFSKH